jgi:hypothetical protein
MGLSPSQRTLRAQIAGNTTHARHDSHAIAARAREGFVKRFLDEADPDRVLPEAERYRRARHLMKAHMARLALKSSKARKARTEPLEELAGEIAEAEAEAEAGGEA